MVHNLTTLVPSVNTLKGYIRPIKRPVENLIAFTAVQNSIAEKKHTGASTLGTQAHTYVMGNGAFGSLGDQALAAGTEALALHRAAPVSILIPGDLEPWKAVGFSKIEPLEPYARIRAARVTRHGEDAFERSNVVVIGADTIDGKYEHPFLAMRVNALNRAAINGHAAKLVNFSISETPTKLSIYLLKKLDERVELWARDVNSQERARRFLNREVHVAPDVAALMKPHVTPRVLDIASRPADRSLTVLVPNGHMATVFGTKWEDLVAFWTDLAFELSRDSEIVVMPHDIRKRHDDPGFSASIVTALAERGVAAKLLVTDSAAEAKGLLAQADLCISGRMHACVAAMSSGTPAVGIDYVQKFQGQFQWYPGLGRTIDFEDALDIKGVLTAVADLKGLESQRKSSMPVSFDDLPWL